MLIEGQLVVPVSTLEYQHAQIYLRNVGALVILSVGGGTVHTWGVAQSEKPPPRRFSGVTETRK